MDTYTYMKCNGASLVEGGQEVFEYFSEPGYYDVAKIKGEYQVRKYLGADSCVVTVTTNHSGVVVCASEELQGKLDGLRIRSLRETTSSIVIPSSLVDDPRCLFPDLAILPEYVVSSKCLYGNVFYSHGISILGDVWGYGGVKIRPSRYVFLETQDIVKFLEDDIEVVPRGGKTNRCSFDWVGAGTYVWKNVNIVIDDCVDEGDTLVVSVPDALLGANKVTYYPYGPTGDKYFEIIQSDDESSAVEQAIQQEVLRNFVNPSVPKGYIDAVKEILANAPSAYKDSDDPILAALGWALAERKGR